MIYLLALIVLVTLAVLSWKAFGPQLRAPSAPKRVVGPEDDPDFIWRMSRPRRTDGTEPDKRDPQ
ncbi:hypothetical protein OG921_00950 [Aldersonia sp. NBC_00410]|uniref:hypothetical protein n=1 Tax=Aldersonia sp. NBC_00410 TaxID=2975954 RepID=UPI00225777F9|nr:hypothetical protein [Aldersonia sp. NBC_00410]MCX5041758.1 hypothetical protein [Aldersonia sp. NBC_00410]